MKTLNHSTKQEIASQLIDAINDGRLLDMEISEIHNEVFNTDYFIIGYYEAEQWLVKNYGIFAAIEKITEYENDNFGEVNTKLDNSESVCNMLVYILGEELMQGLDTISDNWDKRLTKKLQKQLLKELNEI
jgi:hypothetical protein